MGSVRIGVMLAMSADEKNMEKMPETVIFQRKYNGERCRVEWKEGKARLFSSCGNEFPFFGKIKEEIEKYGVEGINYDGELYCHEMGREMIHGICSRRKNKHKDEDKLRLMVFDQISDEIQYERLMTICFPDEAKFIEQTRSYLVSKSEIVNFADMFVKEGFEGVIVRDPNATYKPRKCKSLLKFKLRLF